jgi:heme/copper-type cytochrome/quinol oxidase subunit 2
MSTRARIALLLGFVVIAVVAYIALKPDSTKKSDTTANTQTTVTTTAGGKKKTVKPAPPPVPVVNVKNGKPVGGIKKITFNKGDQVKFTVNSDVSDEIHVHGYDFHKDVKAGGKVSFSFPAKMDGEYVVELESRGEQIANLVVNP